VHDKLGMELTVVVSNPGFSGAHRCFMVPVAAAKELFGTQETAAERPSPPASAPPLRPRHEAPGEFRTSLC